MICKKNFRINKEFKDKIKEDLVVVSSKNLSMANSYYFRNLSKIHASSPDLSRCPLRSQGRSF